MMAIMMVVMVMVACILTWFYQGEPVKVIA